MDDSSKPGVVVITMADEKFQEGLRALSESLSIQHEMNRLVEEASRDWEKFHNERKP